MGKKISFLLLSLFIASDALAVNSNFIPKKFNTVTSHDDVYPYRLNNAKPNSGQKATTTTTISSTSAAPIGKRGVIKRITMNLMRVALFRVIIRSPHVLQII